MQNAGLDGADDPSIMQDARSQDASYIPARRPLPSTASRQGQQVSNSEAGVSIDLSAASNIAAQGEAPTESSQQGEDGFLLSMSRSGSLMRPSDAEKWFQDSNKNASTRGNVSFVDDDPPFHLPQRAPNDRSLRPLPVRTTSGTPQLQPINVPSLHPINSMQSSSSGEFRSVIDDLTVENKELRKRLRQFERMHAGHLHPDRMFEVRMPGLVGKDKQRLERLLKEFASSISNNDTGGRRPKSAKKGLRKGLSTKPSSSSTLDSNQSNQVDSAYASASTPAGNASGSQSQQQQRRRQSDSQKQRGSQPESGSKDQRIQSYLQSIGQGLLPKKSIAMTERARKRAVVKRLEQLFTGKARTNDKNSQSVQQQEVSTAAANADKRASEARGNPVQNEGSREAHILPAEAEAAMLRSDAAAATGRIAPSPAGPATPSDQQRPTRPLDLDLNRAQDAADNVAYMRHLGFKHQSRDINGQPDDDGWIYLNLLIGMAQLHTISVTAEFVRHAIKDSSDKFEVSADGSKVRWKGGSEGTRFSGDSCSSTGSKNASPSDGAVPDSAAKANSPGQSRSSKPSASDQTTGAVKSSGGTDGNSGARISSKGISSSTEPTSGSRISSGKRPIYLGHMGRTSNLQYEPMFLHDAVSEAEDQYFLDEDDSLLSSGLREDITGSGSSRSMRRTSVAGVRYEDGPMIFYHRSRFITDLSGDQGFTPVNNIAYLRASDRALGSKDDSTPRSLDEAKGAISTSKLHLLSDLAYPPTFDPQLPSLQQGKAVAGSALPPQEPRHLPVCGLGGVTPAENLVFYTRHRQRIHHRKDPVSSTTSTFRKCTSHLRSRLFDGQSQLLNRVSPQDEAHVRLEGAGPPQYFELQPSELPAPNYAHMARSSSNDSEESDSNDEEETDENGSDIKLPDFIPPPFMRSHEETTNSSDSEASDEDEEMGDLEDEEMDLLAHERAVNAEEIAEREREWEEENRATSPEAQSSVATVGDRSFLSDEEEGHQLSEMGRDRRQSAHAGSKRGRSEVEGDIAVPASPAKRQETSRTKLGKK